MARLIVSAEGLRLDPPLYVDIMREASVTPLELAHGVKAAAARIATAVDSQARGNDVPVRQQIDALIDVLEALHARVAS